MSVDMLETADAASALLSDALGDWWGDERRKCCAYCGIHMKLRCAKGKPMPLHKATRDHVIPKAHNGGRPKSHNGRGVTIPSCLECNQAKGTKSVPEFLDTAYFTEKRKLNHKNKWPEAHLWLVTALAAMRLSRSG